MYDPGADFLVLKAISVLDQNHSQHVALAAVNSRTSKWW